MEQSNPVRHNNNKATGLFLLLIGGLILAYKMGAPIPVWLMSWPVLLIAIGLFIAIRQNFRNNLWAILIVVGGIFLADNLNPNLNLREFIGPAIIITIGLFFVLRPKRHHRFREEWQQKWESRHQHFDKDWKQNSEALPFDSTTGGGEYIDSTSIFGGTKKVVLSKDFRGGDVTCFMGGAEIDLTKADIQGPVVLDLTMIFGGIKLTVPSNWDIKNKMTPIFGGIEDKRTVAATNFNPEKVLILEGAAIFGGIEIRNF